MTGFEPAASWSQTRRSSQTEPHPAVSFLFCFICLCFVVRRKTYYMLRQPKCQHFFLIFFYFFSKIHFFKFQNPEKPSKIKAFRGFSSLGKILFFSSENTFFEWILKLFPKKYSFSTIKKSFLKTHFSLPKRLLFLKKYNFYCKSLAKYTSTSQLTDIGSPRVVFFPLPIPSLHSLVCIRAALGK